MAVSIGVVGCGQWGMNHVRIFSTAHGSSVGWCCDPKPERLSAVTRQYPHVRTCAELAPVLEDRSVEAVVVATPTSTHYAVARAALEHDKDVMCEKPMGTSAQQCEELIRLAQARQRVLMVGHVFVFNPAVRKLHEYVTRGELGALYYLSARRTNLGPIRGDVDAVWDLASHDLSIFDFLLGGCAPMRVSACAGAFLNSGRADVAFISLEYPDRIVANIHLSWLDPQKRRELTVVGSAKMAIFNDVSLEAPLWLYDKGAAVSHEPYDSFETFRIRSWEREATVPTVPRLEPLLQEAEHFLECVRTRRNPQTDGMNGLRVVELLEAISHSVAQRGAPVVPTARAVGRTPAPVSR